MRRWKLVSCRYWLSDQTSWRSAWYLHTGLLSFWISSVFSTWDITRRHFVDVLDRHIVLLNDNFASYTLMPLRHTRLVMNLFSLYMTILYTILCIFREHSYDNVTFYEYQLQQSTPRVIFMISVSSLTCMTSYMNAICNITHVFIIYTLNRTLQHNMMSTMFYARMLFHGPEDYMKILHFCWHSDYGGSRYSWNTVHSCLVRLPALWA
jgi:hypothetical protein